MDIKTIVTGAIKAKIAPLHSLVLRTDAKLSNLEQEVNGLEAKLDSFEGKMEQRFNEIYDAIQEILGVTSEQTDQKVQKLRSEFHPRIEKLEKVHPQGQHP